MGLIATLNSKTSINSNNIQNVGTNIPPTVTAQKFIHCLKLSAIVLLTALILPEISSAANIRLSEKEQSLNQKQLDNELSKLSLRQKIAQKLTIDLRYFCEPEAGQPLSPELSRQCTTKMTRLTPSLRDMIAEIPIGGVILFSENLKNIDQIVVLTHQLQAAAKNSQASIPLMISVDQEGGRVARLPRNQSTPFTGNMSIGATHKKHRTKYALMTGDIIATELLAVGFNAVHAPNVDVNVNPNNPVINVRSFSEDPKVVAELGSAQSYAFERKGLISTLKHFPGHGDTNVDSHTGLPIVTHDRQTIESKDLFPFKSIIEKNSPGMIMTAHIQYPRLDSSTFISSSGVEMIKPATMSREILTYQLRDKIGYQGVIITDSLSMAGVSDYFDPVDAVINTFKAGADIALMPITIRSPLDIEKLNELIKAVEKAVVVGELNRAELEQSVVRILSLKQRFNLSRSFDTNLATAKTRARNILANKAHKQAEASLAKHAITLVKNERSLIPLNLEAETIIHLVMPDRQKCRALIQSMQPYLASTNRISCSALVAKDHQRISQNIEAADLVIFANISPAQNALEIGGVQELNRSRELVKGMKYQPDQIEQLLRLSQKTNKKTVFLSLRAPYDINRFSPFADAILASYSYNANVVKWPKSPGETVKVGGPAYTAIAKILFGEAEAFGDLPVSLNKSQVNSSIGAGGLNR
jgi:beta-N-acetylhexosaminidase